MRVVFSSRAFTGVMSETLEKLSTETGGLFLGAVDKGTWYVVEAIDPGPHSIFQVAYFEYDQKYTQHLINKIANLYEADLHLIGLWHRHPGSMDVFSRTDDGTNSKYAAMRPQGAISALVNIDPRFRLTMYHVEQPCRYHKIPFEVGDSLLPPHLLRLKGQAALERAINGTPMKRTPPSLGTFMHEIVPMLKTLEYGEAQNTLMENCNEAVELLLNDLYDDLEYLANELGMKITVARQDSYVILSQPDGKVKLYFRRETNHAVFDYLGQEYRYSPHLFQNLTSHISGENNSGTISGSVILGDTAPNGVISDCAICGGDSMRKISSGFSFCSLLSRFGSVEVNKLVRAVKESLIEFFPQCVLDSAKGKRYERV